MLNRVGKDAIGRETSSRRRVRLDRRPVIEALEGRQLMTASIEPIADVTSPQYQGYQVPIVAGTTHQQTYTVTSDNPGVKASITQGRFLTVGVSHTAASATDVTVNGTMTFQLFDDFTPITTSMITSLVNGTATNLSSNVSAGTNFYVGKVFHRVASNFPTPSTYIVQGGSVNGDGAGSAFATPFPDEFAQSVAFTGTGQLAMANTGADTNDSQFFITTGSPQTLSYHHTIFGQIVAGQDILTQLTQVDTGSTSSTTPTNPITITSAAVSDVNPNGVIHLDTTVAPVGAIANVTVTGTDVTDNTTASQTFQVTVGAPSSTVLRPFVGPYDATLALAVGQSAQFQIFPISATPGDPITYKVAGGYNLATQTFTDIDTTKINATVDANGLVTVTRAAGSTTAESTTLLIGVRDDTNRALPAALDSPGNYEYHTITVNLPAIATAVPFRPLTQQATINAVPAGSTPIQLFGGNPNSNTTLPLTYSIVTPPTFGTITALDATTGALTYTPNTNYAGPDAIAYTVTDPNSGLTSFATTIQINVTNASTGAVRFIANDGSNSTTTPGVLVVTPNPRTDGGTNTILASVVNGQVQVSVNGVADVLSPTTDNVDRLIIYGSKASDTITVDDSLTAITTLDGGHGGKNVVTAGGGQTREHGWFGSNTLVQGSSENYQLGRRDRVRFVKGTGTSNVIFAGVPGYFRVHLNQNRQLPVPTTGTYFKFARNGRTLVATANPYNALNQQELATRTAARRLRTAVGTTGTNSSTASPTAGGASSNQGGTISNGTTTVTPAATPANGSATG